MANFFKAIPTALEISAWKIINVRSRHLDEGKCSTVGWRDPPYEIDRFSGFLAASIFIPDVGTKSFHVDRWNSSIVVVRGVPWKQHGIPPTIALSYGTLPVPKYFQLASDNEEYL